MKTMRLRPNCEFDDLMRKKDQVVSWLAKGHQVRVDAWIFVIAGANRPEIIGQFLRAINRQPKSEGWVGRSHYELMF